jgi:hypothetical protein
MMRALKMWAGLGLMIAAATAAQGFALLGPYYVWQVQRIGYNLTGDIGGPKRLNEGYRWTVPVIYYAFDQSFANYFGPKGMAAVEQAIKAFNDLPPMNSIRSDGVNLLVRNIPVPTDTMRENGEAAVLGLLDVKSAAMHLILEELGLAEAERWVWAIRSRATFNNPAETNYVVVQFNYDPITRQLSRFVNGIAYTYNIFEFQNPDIADAEEWPTDILSTFPFSSVSFGSALTFPGRFYTGLTHDDVGGLRWLYGTNNLAVENLLTNVTLGTARTGGSPWAPFFGTTNAFAQGTNFIFSTNLLRIQGLRPGINKFTFKRVNFDSLLGQTFAPITNFYTDTIITNSRPIIQPVQRRIIVPDIVFTAEDLGLSQPDNLIPFLLSRTGTAGWINNDAINGQDIDLDGGPGIIPPPVVIRFSDQLPFLLNSTLFFIPGPGPPGLIPVSNEASAQLFGNLVWASYDGTTNAPVIYPQYGEITLERLRQFVVGGGN